MEWSSQQAAALKAVSKWTKDRRAKQVFRLFGYAGTGKSTLAQEIARNVNGVVIFATFTGKASLVLKSKGCAGARTIHSLIYKVDDPDAEVIEYVLNPDSEAYGASLIIIDEVSMVDDELGRDLESFGVKILVLGDPMQLPPIRGDGYFTNQEPDVMLTEIHRQAADNPIIRLSMDVREGRALICGHYGDSKIIRRADLARDEVLLADQVLVGMNKTRRAFNGRIRALKDFTSPLPQVGDKLICLKNNRERGLLNGSLWTANQVGVANGRVKMNVASLDGLDDPGEVNVLQEFFLGTEDDLDWKLKRMSDEFTFSYAITVHKFQGSQASNIMLFDESASFRENQIRHRYTGITRAADRITIVI
jgi:ATP-dependent exoDNAse (exonuclease V) alpha subunit